MATEAAVIRRAEESRSSFLAGGGEMGARMRALDWATTPLGVPSQWPQSLKTIVRVMLDSRYAMWMLWGPELTFFCNDAYVPTVGNKREWVLGARSDCVWEEIWPDIGPRIGQVLELGQATWDEGLLLFLERSGFPEETYHTFSYSPVYNDDNAIAGMLCVVTEVTERVIGERRLRMLRDLAARTSGVETVEDSCRRQCDVLAEYPLDTPFAALCLTDGADARCVARTRGLTEHVLPDRMPLDGSPWRLTELIETGCVQELRLPEAGIQITAQVWPDPVQHALVLPIKSSGQGRTAGFLIVGVSPRRPLDDAYRSFLNLVAGQLSTAIADAQAFETERRRAEALAEIDRAKTAFFSNVSHEFRTPLTLILGPVEEAVRDMRIPGDARERLQLVHRNSVRLLKLVNSLLDFSRIEAGRVQASYEPTDLAALTRDLTSTFRSAIERGGLRFDVDCDDLHAPVYVDRDMWEKIVLNLLSNALKFTFEGSITVDLRREGDEAVLEIEDTGVGVPAAELPRLFERFHRVESTHSRTHEGSGIGLALVQELAKLHGGTIAVSSELERGTTFTVRVPLGSAHLPADRLKAPVAGASTGIGARAFVEEALRWLPPEKDSTVWVDQRFAATFGDRIVVADDNADMRAYLNDLLGASYSLEVVPDGAEALAAARRKRPDMILSDVMMPRLDGLSLLAAVRSDESLRSIPIVLLSARAGEKARIEGLDAGADDYLTKPFSARELVARVGALLELARMRRQAEESLRRRTAQFETLLNDAPLGVYLVDADFRLVEVNPTALPVFGDIPDLIGRDFGEVLHLIRGNEFADEVVQRFRRTLEMGEPYVSPERIEHRENGDAGAYYEWQISRITLPDGRFGVVCYFRDVSAHVRARAALETADRQKDEFLAMLAHELRNPLAPLRNASELLARTANDDPQTLFIVDVVRRQISQLTRLVDDLLDVSRITQGRIELKRTPLELSAIVAQAVETVEPLLREKRHAMSIVSNYQPLYVNGDNARLVQCVTNVLTNAAKYTDANGEIRIRSYSTGTSAVIEIRDNGVGIAPDLLPRIFDLFVQSDRTLDRSEGGLGVGLSVVRRLVEMHGGTVVARSAGVGVGSTFEIRLPLIERPRSAVRDTEALDVAPRRVLIVDDNVDAANTLALILRLDGHNAEAVYSSKDVVASARALKPDVILLDIGLPEMNGYDVAQVLRSDPELQTVRLVALTGYGQAEDRRRTRAAGFDDHLVKPVDAAALKRTIAAKAARPG
jgi:PAS domain S-box-containing protein